MDAILWEWAGLAVRWLHLIAGITGLSDEERQVPAAWIADGAYTISE